MNSMGGLKGNLSLADATETMNDRPLAMVGRCGRRDVIEESAQDCFTSDKLLVPRWNLEMVRLKLVACV